MLVSKFILDSSRRLEHVLLLQKAAFNDQSFLRFDKDLSYWAPLNSTTKTLFEMSIELNPIGIIFSTGQGVIVTNSSSTSNVFNNIAADDSGMLPVAIMIILLLALTAYLWRMLS